jgi:hypothetical protein
MRGYPLDLNVLSRKIAAINHAAYFTYTDKAGVTHRHRRRAMDKGWMSIWRREWVFLWRKLEGNSDPKAVNIRRKLCGGYTRDGNGVFFRNKLYLTKPETPWLIEWLKQQCQNGIDGKYFQ